MVFVVQVKNIRGASRMVGKIVKGIPVISNTAAYNIARHGAKQIKLQARMAGLKPWGGGALSLFRDTKAKKLSKGNFIVTTPIHTIWQDRARPHWVSVKRGRLLARWAADKGFEGRSFYFRPRHFIHRAFNNTRRKAIDIALREVRKTIREAR